jgi:N-acetylneuraminic acid mutarotase
MVTASKTSSAVIFHGRIYVAGGNDSTGTPVAKVYSAKIGADGTLAAWQTLSDLPVALAYHQLATSGGYLYVLGGTTVAVDPVSNAQSASAQANIYLEAINIRNGGLSSLTWNTNATAMGKAREKFTAVAAGSYLLISGGLYNGASTGSSEQSYAAINADGSIGSFNGATGSHTISGSTSGYNFFNHAATLFVDTSGNPHVLVLGGSDTNTGAPHAGVWYQH